MVLDKLPGPGRPTIWMTVGQGPTAFAVGAGGGCLDIFTLLYLFSPISPSLWETARYRLKYCLISPISPSLWETARYRLKYCLKGPLNPKQPTNQAVVRNIDRSCAIYMNFTVDSKLCYYSRTLDKREYLMIIRV